MFYNNLKNFLKKKFPKVVKKLIVIRDSSKFMRYIKNFFFINLKKNIHGKKIISKERGLLFDFTLDNFVSYYLRPKTSSNIKNKKRYIAINVIET